MSELSSYILIAEIRKAAEEPGYVVLRSYSDFPDRFFELEKVYIDVYGGIRTFYIEEVVECGEEIQLKFQNFDTDQDVNFLHGKKVYVDAQESVLLDENTFFIHDLVGCKVLLNDKFFGNLIDVIPLEANDVYVVNNEEGKEILIPAVKDYVKSIDIESKVIHLTEMGIYLDGNDED